MDYGIDRYLGISANCGRSSLGITAAAQIRLIAIYTKGVKDDLNAAEKKVLKKLNENW